MLNFTEINKLAKGLIDRGISFMYREVYNGKQILCEDWDAVCHDSSYGHEKCLIEVMGKYVFNDLDEVEGWLTAEEILIRINNNTSGLISTGVIALYD